MTENHSAFDIIGDVHGHARILVQLLHKLGYVKRHDGFHHPGRTAIFIGDLIDRGPENFKTLEIAKTMVDTGNALIVMGNHEYNALCFHTRDPGGHFLRPHTPKNISQHREVLAEIDHAGMIQWEMYLEWFRRMPLFLELPGLRIVHACWDPWSIDFIKKNHCLDHQGRMTDDFLYSSAREGTDAFKAIEILLKGLEISLPQGHPGVFDRDRNLRKELRLKWWMNPEEWQNPKTYDQVVRADENVRPGITGLEIPADILAKIKKLKNTANTGTTPVFFGHYWFTGEPQLLTGTAACLDYSVAHQGKLVCYRWDGEPVLNPEKFVYI